MNRRLPHILAALYGLAIGALLYCAHTSYVCGSLLHTGLFLALAVLFGCAIGHHAYHRDELRAAHARIERLVRPEPAVDGVIAVALAAACCEMWWTSAGAEHEAGCRHQQEERA